MSSFPGGAGDLGSYMGGGGDETPSQSTTAGNGQAILLLVVASAVAMFLLSVKFDSNTKGGNGGLFNNGKSEYVVGSADDDGKGKNSDDYDNDKSDDGNSNSSKKNKYYDDDNADDDDLLGIKTNEYNSLEDLSLDELFSSLAATKTWVKVMDDDLILKVLENKTFENSIEDDFDVEISKVRDVNDTNSEYLVKINLKEEVAGGGIHITSISAYDVYGNVIDISVPNTSSKMFTIAAPKQIKLIRLITKENSVNISGNIRIGNIVEQNIQDTNYLIFDVASDNDIETVELLDNNNTVKSVYSNSSNLRHFQLKSKDEVTKIRVIDKNGFIEEKTI